MDSMTLFIASLAVSCIGALASVLLIKADNAAKTAGCLIGAVAAVLSFAAGIQAVLGDVTSVDTIVFFPFAHFQLLLNQLSGLFVALISVLAFAGSIYGLNYFDEYPGKKGRAGFFFNTFVASMMLVITADNVFWFLVAFELMSLTSYFLVVIEENENSIHGGWLYFVIAHVGFVLIMASFLLMTNGVGGSFSFSDFRTHDFGPAVASVCFVLAFFGFGAKAGIIPLHGWLPTAHPVAPAPASAVLSGVITKMGVLAIVRVTFFLIGPQLLSGSWAQAALLVLSLVTVFLGSMLAYREKLLKKRLAWSTVSQVSYVLFGIFLLNEVALQGALLQLVFHAVAKNGLFLAAGAIIFVTGRTRTDQMQGVGLQLPWILAGFTVCALSLIGIPPLAGFWSKWDLILGALDAPVFTGIAFAGVIVLLVSAILTAGYLLPIVRDAYFPGARFRKPERMPAGGCLTWPVLGYALLLIVLGLVPGLCGTVAGLLGAGLF